MAFWKTQKQLENEQREMYERQKELELQRKFASYQQAWSSNQTAGQLVGTASGIFTNKPFAQGWQQQNMGTPTGAPSYIQMSGLVAPSVPKNYVFDYSGPAREGISAQTFIGCVIIPALSRPQLWAYEHSNIYVHVDINHTAPSHMEELVRQMLTRAEVNFQSVSVLIGEVDKTGLVGEVVAYA